MGGMGGRGRKSSRIFREKVFLIGIRLVIRLRVNSRFRSSSSREYERNVERRDIGRENFFQVFPNLFQSNSKFSIMFVYMYIYIYFHFFLLIEEYTE